MKKNKILSIVIPTYNVEKYLDRCILSLVYDRDILDLLDIIIVNDGSKDRSVEVAKKYEKLFPESITVIDKKNGGHGSTINAGLKAATGKYFRVIDSDDWVNIDDFTPFVKSLQKLDSDLVITNYSRELVYDGTRVLAKYKNLEDNMEYDLNTMDLSIFGDDYLYMATSTVKTEKLRKAGLVLDENTFYVDMEYNILPINELSTFTFLDLDIYRYWIGRPQQSIDIRNTFKNRAHHEKVLRRLVEFYSKTKLNKNKRAYIRKIIVLMLNSHYFIYCGQKVPRETVIEISTFDKWLKSTSPELYKAVSEKFDYITLYRDTNFAFLKVSPKTFKKISDRISAKKKQEEK